MTAPPGANGLVETIISYSTIKLKQQQQQQQQRKQQQQQ